jgi:lysophospholipase L1-like esterase
MHRYLLAPLFVSLAACPASHDPPLDGGPAASADGAIPEPEADAGGEEPDDAAVAEPDAGGGTAIDRCFADIMDPDNPGPDYYTGSEPVVGGHCIGTDHQEIEGVQRLVFLGDSITEGTFPTPSSQYYRTVLTESLQARFGEDLEVSNCADLGATSEDLLRGSNSQIERCFPEPEPRTTLVVMTMGGNDMRDVAQDSLGGADMETTLAAVDAIVERMREGLTWFREDPDRFPGGVFVVFGNVYEFTDGEGDLPSCPGAAFAGLRDPWPEGRQAFLRLNEGLMDVAVDTGTDLLLLLENFCGHGYHAGDPDNQCYRGPDAERWFDFTCIHPNPTGHAEVARMFLEVVEE